MSDLKPSTLLATPRSDLVAVGLSAVCLIHCLGLPLLATALPIMAAAAEAEWIHKLFVLLALPISISVMWRRADYGRTWGLTLSAVAGLSLLMAGAFVEALHEFERPLTLAGALLLSLAHLTWWRRHRRGLKT